MRQLLPDLTKAWPEELIRPYQGPPYKLPPPQYDPATSSEIVHEYFWHRLPDFIPENSIVVAETGTSEFGKDVVRKSQCTFFFYSSTVSFRHHQHAFATWCYL